jgi:hypothetical protein
MIPYSVESLRKSQPRSLEGPNGGVSFPSPEDSNRPSFRNVVFSSYLKFRMMDKFHKPCDSECCTSSPEPFTFYSTTFHGSVYMIIRSIYWQWVASAVDVVWNLFSAAIYTLSLLIYNYTFRLGQPSWVALPVVQNSGRKQHWKYIICLKKHKICWLFSFKIPQFWLEACCYPVSMWFSKDGKYKSLF